MRGTPSCSGVPFPRCPHPIPTSSRQGAGCLCLRTQRGWEHTSEPRMGTVRRRNPVRAIPRPGSATCSPASPTGLLSALPALGGLSSRSYLPAFWALLPCSIQPISRESSRTLLQGDEGTRTEHSPRGTGRHGSLAAPGHFPVCFFSFPKQFLPRRSRKLMFHRPGRGNARF